MINSGGMSGLSLPINRYAPVTGGKESFKEITHPLAKSPSPTLLYYSDAVRNENSREDSIPIVKSDSQIAFYIIRKLLRAL